MVSIKVKTNDNDHRSEDQKIASMVGKTFFEVISDGETLMFRNEDETYYFNHNQDCCECVAIEDIAGELSDLVGYPLTMAEVSESENDSALPPPDGRGGDSYTWTFYKFATVKGYVTVRFFGDSNGFYSETVTIHNVKNKKTIN